jgi:kynureninase
VNAKRIDRSVQTDARAEPARPDDGTASGASVELTAYRERFPILAETNYLISHSLGPMPREAERRLAQYAHTWNTRGIRAWGEGWWDMSLTAGDEVARLIGAPPGSTVMHQNVTIAEAVVLSCFDLRGDRRRIVYEEENFPSVRYLYQAQRTRGAEIVVCPDEEAIIEAIDERTLLVPISHVIFKTGRIQEVEPIIRRAHEVGAHVVLDAYQSVGTVPLDVTALDVDFAVGGSVKWLCGGPGAAWLYIRPDLAERLEPTLVGWQAHARPFAFEPELELAQGAARFLTGTPNVPALHAATAGYEIIEEIGVERIRENSMRQTAYFIALLDEAGFDVVSPREPERRGASVVVRVPDYQAVHAELERRQILLDVRPDVGLRFGPHFFTTDEELESAAAAVVEIVGRGAKLSA